MINAQGSHPQRSQHHGWNAPTNPASIPKRQILLSCNHTLDGPRLYVVNTKAIASRT